MFTNDDASYLKWWIFNDGRSYPSLDIAHGWRARRGNVILIIENLFACIQCRKLLRCSKTKKEKNISSPSFACHLHVLLCIVNCAISPSATAQQFRADKPGRMWTCKMSTFNLTSRETHLSWTNNSFHTSDWCISLRLINTAALKRDDSSDSTIFYNIFKDFKNSF